MNKIVISSWGIFCGAWHGLCFYTGKGVYHAIYAYLV